MIENYDSLTEIEKRYINSNESTITVPSIIFRTTMGVVLVALSSLVVPSAETKVPFSSFLINTKKRAKFTKYKKAIENKLNNSISKKDEKILKKLNSEPYIFDIDESSTKAEEENIEKIYDEYMKEHNNDNK